VRGANEQPEAADPLQRGVLEVGDHQGVFCGDGGEELLKEGPLVAAVITHPTGCSSPIARSAASWASGEKRGTRSYPTLSARVSWLSQR
jgi:hypothetical protein